MKQYFKTYIWLLETLQARGPLTLNEIKALWGKSPVNDDGRELATRTFANHVAAIGDIFGIDIVCDRRDNTYYIDNEDALNGNGVRDWMMEALSINNLINESAGLRSRILFESEPSSHRFLTVIIRAIRDERMLEVNYQSFNKDKPSDCLLEPFCLKEYKRRWYLFARDSRSADKEPHPFALDRMNSVAISEKHFSIPKNFDCEQYFSTHYGVLYYDDSKPVLIKLKVSAQQAKYFRTLPLHSSQVETETNDEYSIFSYFLAPNWHFTHDILSFGEQVEVLEPKGLRKDIRTIIKSLANRYNYE